MSTLHRRGQPLASVGLLLALWLGLRAAVWEPPFPLTGAVGARGPADRVAVTAQTARRTMSAGRLEDAALPLPRPGAPSARPTRAASAVAPTQPGLPPARVAPLPLAMARPAEPARLPPPAVASYAAAAHQLLYLAALGRLPLPPGLALAAASPPPLPAPVTWDEAAPRWSGDGWVLVRRGSGGIAAASGFPAYGASQAGGVVRFALNPGSPRAAQAYLRVSRALGGFGEGEVATGLSARPIAGVPLRLLGEARVQRSGSATRARPAASLVSELPPVRLPLGIDGDLYAQAGYAGAPFGSKRGATPFFDVQAVADRPLASAGFAELRLGAGVWSGGQRGAARLDLGPRTSLRLDTGPARSRVALDWRFRIAGNARPASGPTLTFSTGF